MMGNLDKAETSFGPKSTLAKKVSNGDRAGLYKGQFGQDMQ